MKLFWFHLSPGTRHTDTYKAEAYKAAGHLINTQRTWVDSA